jgi:hypothetical protein
MVQFYKLGVDLLTTLHYKKGMELTPIPNLRGYYMADAVSVYKLKKGRPDPVHPIRKNDTETGFYVRVLFNGKRTLRSVKRLAEVTFGSRAEPDYEGRVRIPEYPSYVFFMDDVRLRVFKGLRQLTANRHPRGKQNYYSMVNYAGKRTSVRESTIRVMAADCRQ